MLQTIATGAIVCCAPVTKAAVQPVSPGIWGGDRANLTIETSGTQIEFDCGMASVKGTLRLNPDKSFSANGFFEDYAARPVDPDQPPKHRAAHFYGQFSDEMLNLTVKINGEVAPRKFRLMQNRRVKLIRCM